MDERDLAALLTAHAARHGVPGAAAGLLREGEATTACCGLADVSTGAPVTAATRWSAASLTKTMVATAVTLLADRGVVALDDPVAARVPELRDTAWARRATLRDLLANRSPIPLCAGLEFGFDDRREGDDRALARLAADVAAAAPTAGRWSYSNTGFCLLGRAIEAAAGRPWEEEMRRTLFEPAGMSGAAFETEGVPELRVRGHQPAAGGPVPVPPLVSRAYGPAGTSVVLTAADLLRFAALHLADPALAPMRTVEAEIAIHGWSDAWCRGWARFDWDGVEAWGWDGLVNGERSALRVVPDRRAAIVLLANSGAGRAMHRSFLAAVMAAALGIQVPPLRLDPVTGAAGDLARFAGEYAWPDRRVEVSAVEDGLRIRRDGAEARALPIGERVFLVDAADPDTPTVTFGAFDAAGRPHVLYDMLWGLSRVER
jgi:CubicO group peptidase (beta-lactamase class C family)